MEIQTAVHVERAEQKERWQNTGGEKRTLLRIIILFIFVEQNLIKTRFSMQTSSFKGTIECTHIARCLPFIAFPTVGWDASRPAPASLLPVATCWEFRNFSFLAFSMTQLSGHKTKPWMDARTKRDRLQLGDVERERRRHYGVFRQFSNMKACSVSGSAKTVF